MPDRLDSRRAHYFIQVIKSGSVRGAAETLEMDPSAVSRAISLLERDCGITLFERRGRGVTPTDAGRLLAQHLKRQQGMVEGFFSDIDSLRNAQRGHIDLVLGEGFVELIFDQVLPAYWRAHPEVTLDISVAGTSDIVQRILDDRAYLALVFQPPPHERLHTHYHRPEPICAVVHKNHPLASLRRPLLLSDLHAYPGAAMQEGFGVRQHVQAAEISEQIRLNYVLTTSSFKALCQFAATGMGYALLPPLAIGAEQRASHLLSLPMLNPILNQGSLHVLSRSGRHISPAARELLNDIVHSLGGSQPEAPTLLPE